jgi:serine/threonine protein phosphatase 1
VGVNYSLAVARGGNKTVGADMSKGRVIAIGDVHGCHKELKDLLEKVEPRADDSIVLLGDLINRGPDSHAVIEIARAIRAKCLLGNHEFRLLEFRRTGDDSHIKDEDRRTLKQLTPHDWTFMERMPLHHHIPELDTVLVHGGFLPGAAWETQPAAVVTRIQVIDRDGRPRKRSELPNAPHWTEHWKGPPFVIYGHTSREEIHERPYSLGIDTACAMGGRLTACILPGREIIQVKARDKYY